MDAIRYVFGMDRDLPEIKDAQVQSLYEEALGRLNDADIIFTTFAEGNEEHIMTQERAEQIIEELPSGDFRLETTFIRLNNGNWLIEKSRNPIRDSSRKHLFTLNRSTRPGALVGIDALFYDVAYPITVVIYAGYKINTPNPENLQPMRHPGNCVGRLVREFFNDAARGNKLTPKRQNAIKMWETSTASEGGTINNIRKLEKAIERPIVVLDILGSPIYPGTHKYRGRGSPINIYQHNGHAWREVKFPMRKSVVVYDVNPFDDMIYENCIWLLDEDNTQFITQDGTLYRPRVVQQQIEEECESLGEDFADEVFSSKSLDFMAARRRNGWKPTPKDFKDITYACVEHGHGGLWNQEYDSNDYVSLDMRHCYPASFKGLGDCSKYYNKYGHPAPQFFRVALENNIIPEDVTGFVKLTTWKFKDDLHPLFYAWYARHILEKHWLLIPLLQFLVDNNILQFTADEAILAKSVKTQWLPKDNHASRIVIGKFTQGSRNGEMYLQRRIVTNDERLNFLIKRSHEKGVLVGAEKVDLLCEGSPINSNYWVLTYYHEQKPQYYHLRASMLAYAHINLLSMLITFNKEDIPHVATDSLYIPKSLEDDYPKDAPSGEWRIKDEEIRTWRSSVQQQEYPHEGSISLPANTYLPSAADPISYNPLYHLYGPGGSGKTTRVLDLFDGKLKILTLTHRLERELCNQGYDAQTYHSFFRYNG